MSDIHNNLQYENKYNHWKILDFVLDFISFSNPNPTHSVFDMYISNVV